MGGVFSSDEGNGNCRVLDERSTYILVRNYVVILKIVSMIETLLNGNAELFNNVRNNFGGFLVDSQTMLELITELPENIANQFAVTEQKVVGVNEGSPVYKTISFYDTYNDFFFTEIKTFASFDDAKFRLNELSDNLKKKAEVVESLITSMCVREVGI